MGKIKQSKRAQFFSIDAMIALSIIVLVVMTVYPSIKTHPKTSEVPSDIIEVLNTIKVGEIDGINLNELNITNPDKLVIEQIGEFYLTNEALAKNLSETILSSINERENIGIWYGNTLLAAKNTTPFEDSKNVITKRQIVSGIGGIAGVTGMSTRAYITSSLRTDYLYFGGYVGEGNITSKISYSGNITSATIELAINEDFEIFVNGNSIGTFQASPSDSIPVRYNLSTSEFISGNNTIEIKGELLHISGGFLKIVYDSEVIYEEPSRYYFPGISGAVNLYDGFYIPGDLTGLSIFLRLNNSIETFLTIANTTVFNATTSGAENFTIDNTTLASLLNYQELSRKTIPLRLGMENISYVENNSRDIDVFSVTDLSGSMAPDCEGSSPWYCCWFYDCSVESTCTSTCSGTLTNKIDDAKNANDLFIDMILNESGNRVGLSGYATSAPDSTYHPLSDDNVSLKSEVSSWTEGGNTCICCGVNKAIAGLVADSSSNKFQSIVVMSDGEANLQCSEQGTGNAEDDAIQAACDAWEDYGIKVYTIGFGSGAGVQTLTDMASCGDGSFFSTVSDLESIYEKIAEELIETAYYEQTIEVSGDYRSELFSDSYIEFDYKKDPAPTGLVSTIKKQFDNSSAVTFDIPENYTAVDVSVISYSGPRWTSQVQINGNDVYNLTKYNEEFIKIGDPYSIRIPAALINTSNTLTLGTGLSSDNTTVGSINNSIIYTISRELASYNSVSAFAAGCNWLLEFASENKTMPIPTNYSGSANCYFTSDNITCAEQLCEDSVDAAQISTYNLFKTLDFNGDGIIDIELTDDDLQIEISILEGIPFYHSTEVQVRKWD